MPLAANARAKLIKDLCHITRWAPMMRLKIFTKRNRSSQICQFLTHKPPTELKILSLHKCKHLILQLHKSTTRCQSSLRWGSTPSQHQRTSFQAAKFLTCTIFLPTWRFFCFTLKIKGYRCYEVKLQKSKKLAVTGNLTWGLWLSCQCSGHWATTTYSLWGWKLCQIRKLSWFQRENGTWW